MAVTQNTYTGNGSTTNYSLTFQYLEEDEIKVTLNGTLTTAYTLANATTISFTTAPANGVAIRIYRDTDVDTLQSTFFAGSAIRAQDLNDNFLQSNYSVQEIKDRFLDRTGGTLTGALDAGGFKITNVGTPTNNADASTKAYVDSQVGSVSASATAAAASASAAAASQSAAATSATNSANSATASASSASAALASQTAAAASASSASTSASNASTSASNAATSASNASTSATNAANSATSAASSAASALAAFDSFDDRYLGAKASDPTVDNDGDPLNAGDLYYNTTSSVMKVYTGSAWVVAYVPGDAASISFSPYSTIASNNVQGAVQELTDEKLNLSGGTLTGALNVTNGTASTPSVVISGDSATGLYSPGYGQVALSTTGAGRLFISSIGDVGIGTSSPSEKLTVSGKVQATTEFKSETGNDLRLNAGSANRDIFMQVNGSTLMTVQGSTGRVGIGTATPSAPLHINGTANNSAITLSVAGTVTGYIGPAGFIGGSDSNMGYRVESGNSHTFHTGATERARIDSSGRLLVGTSISTNTANTGSTQNIQVQGTGNFANISVIGNTTTSSGGYLTLAKSRSTLPGSFASVTSGDNLGGISFEGADGSAYRVGASIDAFVDGTPGSFDMPGRLVFSTTADGASSPTERMRITSDGHALVGTTSSLNPANGFSLYYASLNSQLHIGHGNTAPNGNAYVVFSYNSGAIGTIVQNGTTGVTYNTSSDYRLKENVSPINDAIARVQQLKPSRFNFITEPDRIVDGFIAHEAQAVVPECVTGKKDAVDDDGNPVYQGIDQSKLVPLLTAALQEAVAEIKALKDRVTALESV